MSVVNGKHVGCSKDHGVVPFPNGDEKLSNEPDFPELVYLLLVERGTVPRSDKVKKAIRNVIIGHYSNYNKFTLCKFLEMICELEDTIGEEIPSELYQEILDL